jgi:hypothetical protein
MSVDLSVWIVPFRSIDEKLKPIKDFLVWVFVTFKKSAINLHDSLKEIIHKLVSKATNFCKFIKEFMINTIFMRNDECFLELFPNMNRFHWKCPKQSFNSPFECEDEQSTCFIIVNNLKILFSDVKMIKMHECRDMPFTIEFEVWKEINCLEWDAPGGSRKTQRVIPYIGTERSHGLVKVKWSESTRACLSSYPPPSDDYVDVGKITLC